MAAINEKQKFIIELTAEEALTTEKELAQAGIGFKAKESLFIMDEDDDAYLSMQSDDMEALIETVNRGLEGQEGEPRVPLPHNLQQTIEALHLAYHEFRYRKCEVDELLWKDTGNTWEQVKARYPALFKETV